MENKEILLSLAETIKQQFERKGIKGKLTLYEYGEFIVVVDCTKDSKVIYFAVERDGLFVNANTLKYDFETQVELYTTAKKSHHAKCLSLFGVFMCDELAPPNITMPVDKGIVDYIKKVYEDCKTNIGESESSCIVLFNYENADYLMYACKITVCGNEDFNGAIYRYNKETNMFFNVTNNLRPSLHIQYGYCSVMNREIKLYNSNFKIAYNILKSFYPIQGVKEMNSTRILTLNYALNNPWFESLLKIDPTNSRYVIHTIENLSGAKFSEIKTIYDFYKTTNKTVIKAIQKNNFSMPQIEDIVAEASSSELTEIFTKKMNLLKNVVDNENGCRNLSHIFTNIKRLTDNKISCIRVLDYIDNLYTHQYLDYNEAKYRYLEYLDFLLELKTICIDEITKERLFPKQLLLQLCKIKRDRKNLEEEILNTNIESWCNKFTHLTFVEDNFTIKPIQSLKELIQEGDKMRSCVGSYSKLYSMGVCIIFSIRNNEDINKPLCTIEYRPAENKIIQVKEPYNAEPSEQTKRLIKKWCEKFKIEIAY